MRSFKTQRFKQAYAALPTEIQKLADKQYELWKEEPYHPSLHFKCVEKQGNIWSVRVTRGYRALGVRDGGDIVWFWIGDHDKYEKRL